MASSPEPPALGPELLRLVEIEARRVARRVPAHAISLEDLVGYGRLGLIEARDRFDPRRGVNFETFARHRIRGAIFDGLRATGVFRRRAWEDLRRQALAHEALGDPAPIPAAGPDRAQDALAVADAITSLATLFLVDASAALQAEGGGAEGDASAREDLDRLDRAVEKLAPDDREVLAAIYDLEQSGDSGAALARRRGVSRSHVSRRHLWVLQRLRGLMGEGSGR